MPCDCGLWRSSGRRPLHKSTKPVSKEGRASGFPWMERGNLRQMDSSSLLRLKWYRLRDMWSIRTHSPQLASNERVISSHTVSCDNRLPEMIKSLQQHPSSGNNELIWNPWDVSDKLKHNLLSWNFSRIPSLGSGNPGVLISSMKMGNTILRCMPRKIAHFP